MIVPYVSSRPLRGTQHLAGGRLGALGTSPLVGTVVSKGATLATGIAVSSAIGTAAGTAGGALFGAAAGSVVPVIGTIVGAVVGILTQKLFGHANYAAVYASVANVIALFNAYRQVAGQYVGRQYGWPEIQYIWHGALHSGLFPGNGPPPGVLCTQAMISNKINACGTGQWIDDLLGTSKPSASYAGSIANLIYKGLAQGIIDPVTMTDSVLVPGMEALAAGKNNGWISVSRSSNPALYRQLLMDTADYMMSTVNSSLPAYYGTQNVQPLPNATAPPPPAAPVQSVSVPMPPPMPQQQIQPVASVSAPAQPVCYDRSSGMQISCASSVISIPPTPPALASVGGTIAPVDATAAYIAALQAQGMAQSQAASAAIAQLQAQGLSAQAAQSTVAAAAPYDTSALTPQAAPVVPTSAGLSNISGGAVALVLGGLLLSFALARPKGGKVRRRSL